MNALDWSQMFEPKPGLVWMFAVQFISRRALLQGGDVEDLNWQTWPGHDDYATEAEAEAAAEEFNCAFEDYCHRVIERIA